MEAKLTCRFLELFTAAPRSVCDTRLGGTGWGRHKSMSAGELARLCCRGEYAARRRLRASSSCPVLPRVPIQQPRTCAGSPFTLERPWLAEACPPPETDPPKACASLISSAARETLAS